MRFFLFALCWAMLQYVDPVGGFHHQAPPPSSSPSSTPAPTRRQWIRTVASAGGGVVLLTAGPNVIPPAATAAPPFAVIAEELGYFPVQKGKDGDVVYVPKRVKRPSTPQAVELATALRDAGLTMYGAYWCPHCSRQKEVFGAEAWSLLNYVECSPKGYSYQGGKLCKGVDGYPTFRDKKGKINFSGERSLEAFAQTIGFSSFDPSLEDEVPMPGTTCKLR